MSGGVARPVFVALVFLHALTAPALAVTRVALTAPAGTGRDAEGVLDVAQAQLAGGTPDVECVERQEIGRVLSEQRLSLSGLVDADAAVKAGRLVTADVLAVYDPAGGTGTDAADGGGIIIFDAKTGVRLWDAAVAGNGADRAAQITAAVRASVRKRAQGASLRTACVLAVRNADLPREMDGLCDGVGRLVERELVRSPAVALLERGRLDAVTRERALSDEAERQKLLASLVTIDLEVARDGDSGRLRATAIPSDWTGKPIGQPVTVTGARDAGGLADGLATALARRIDIPLATAPPDTLAEAARFAREAALRNNADDPMRGVPAAEAAHALAPRDPLYAALLCRCLADHGFQIYQGPSTFRPAGVPRSWPDRQAPPPPLRRAAELLADIRLADDAAAAKARPVVEAAFAQVCRFIGYATADAIARGDPTPRPGPDLARIKHDVRDYLLADDARRAAGVHDLNSFIEYCRRFAALLNDDAMVYSCSPAEWTADMVPLVERWVGMHAKWPTFQGMDVAKALGAISVGWQSDLNPHLGVMIYPFGGNRTRRWDPAPDDVARLESARQALARDPSPLARWHAELMSLSIASASKSPPGDLKERVGAFIAEIERAEAAPEYAADREIRYAQYLLMTDADGLLAHTPAAGAFRQRIFEFALGRRELVNFVFAGGVFEGKIPGRLDAAERDRRIGAIQRILKVLDDPRLQAVCGIPDAERNYYRNELAKLTDPSNPLAGRPVTSPPGNVRRLVDSFDDDRALQFTLQPLPQGGSACVLRMRRDQPTDPLEAQLVRFPLAGGAAEQVSAIPTSIKPPWNQPRENRSTTRYMLDVAACLDEGVYCVATWRNGILMFPTDGSTPVRLDADAGLPSQHGTAVAMLNGRLYAAVGTYPSDGYLVGFDPRSRQLDVLASFRRKQKLSPFDDGTAFEIPGLVADRARGRLIVAIQRFEPTTQLNGIWEFRPGTGQWKQLLPMRLILPENAHTGGILTRIIALGRVEGEDAIPVSTSTGLFLFDLKSDAPRNLFQHDIGQRELPLPRDAPFADWSRPEGRKAAVEQWTPIQGTVAVLKPWVWTRMRRGGWGRVNLSTGQTETFRSPRQGNYPFQADYLEPVPGGDAVLVGDAYGLWVVSPPAAKP